MTDANGRSVARVSQGGSVNHGQSVRFDFVFDDDSTEPFQCPYETLPRIVQALMLAGRATEQVRQGMPQPSLDLVAPHKVVNLRVGHAPLTQEITIQFQTDTGVPVLVTMSPNMATVAMLGLGTAISQNKPTHDHRS
jgi:hypothetical protein